MAWLNRGDVPLVAAVQAATEGIALSAFSADRYKSGERGAPPLDQALIIAGPVEEPSELEAAIERGRILGESSNIARELCNEPSNVLTPLVFAERANEICAAAGIDVNILGEREIADARTYAVSAFARDIVAVDLSEAVDLAFAATRGIENAHVIQADIYHLPLRAVFDYAFSVGVLHHLPDLRRIDGGSVVDLVDHAAAKLWISDDEVNVRVALFTH